MNREAVKSQCVSGCHACCEKAGAPPFATAAELAALPQGVRGELEAYRSTLADGRPSREALHLKCLWLTDAGRCRHYDHRPRICRDFAPGSAACRSFVELTVHGA